MSIDNLSNPNIELSPVKRLVSKRDIGIEAFELENGNVMLEATFSDPPGDLALSNGTDPKK